jgi:hypothetical protein
MKNLITVLSMTLLSSSVFASGEKSYESLFASPTTVQVRGYKESDCAESKGAYDRQTKLCSINEEDTVSIQIDDNGKRVLKISVIFGSAPQVREFVGAVTSVSNQNVLTVQEVILNDQQNVDSFQKYGCVLTAKVEKNVISLALGKNCDADLMRASGATKK